jgi:hypothetical protein
MTNIENRTGSHDQGFRFIILLLSLVAVLLVPPYFDDLKVLSKIWGICISLVMLAALYSLAGKRRTLLWLLVLLIPSFLASWFQVFTDSRAAIYADNLTTILYLALVGYHLMRYILNTSVVTSNAIYAALCLYMVLALIWGGIYHLHYLYDPGCFGFSSDALTQLANSPETTFNLFNYYSFVTLTTLGYGDIVPLTPVTQAWVAVEATVGQFYLAIIIARLVSSYSDHKQRSS